jgi:hypothetical protein
MIMVVRLERGQAAAFLRATPGVVFGSFGGYIMVMEMKETLDKKHGQETRQQPQRAQVD